MYSKTTTVKSCLCCFYSLAATKPRMLLCFIMKNFKHKKGRKNSLTNPRIQTHRQPDLHWDVLPSPPSSCLGYFKANSRYYNFVSIHTSICISKETSVLKHSSDTVTPKSPLRFLTTRRISSQCPDNLSWLINVLLFFSCSLKSGSKEEPAMVTACSLRPPSAREAPSLCSPPFRAFYSLKVPRCCPASAFCCCSRSVFSVLCCCLHFLAGSCLSPSGAHLMAPSL